eukprot:TRINITY_DN3233_c0_g1_i1.p2 TRINITY_DN3233_c0_g1~~TRINITY_DN3233_c0_g1_i1.p2  ORF type:complete len:237 (-),score=70.91 TRINITY_DN3233_c0_g1_i1:139-849(-)
MSKRKTPKVESDPEEEIKQESEGEQQEDDELDVGPDEFDIDEDDEVIDQDTSDEEAAEFDSDDSDAEAYRKAKGIRKKKITFEEALAQILGQKKDKMSIPASQANNQENAKLKQALEKQKLKKLLYNKDHHPVDVSKDAEFERKLRRIATKGVVQLFNIINDQQRENNSMTLSEGQSQKTTKEGIMKKIGNIKQREKEERKENNRAAHQSKAHAVLNQSQGPMAPRRKVEHEKEYE